MRFRFGGRTDVGPTRMVNEDAYRVDADLGCVAVVDGVGGISAGQVAAAIACDAALALVRRSAQDAAPCWPHPPDPLRSEAENLLVAAARFASNRILARSTSDPRLTGMGAAAVFALFDPVAEHVAMAHVGDTEAMRLRRGSLVPLLRTHTLVNDYGFAMSAADRAEVARVHPNVITRALGMTEDVLVDSGSWRLELDDVFLLCTDGLTSELARPAVAEILSAEPDPERAANALVDAAIAAGARDNVTVVVVRCDPS
jgi:protein phosphatase